MSVSSVFTPNLFVIGAAKAASSSLQRWLADHPDIVGSKQEETRFLMDSDDPLARSQGYAATGLAGYSDVFPETAMTARHALDVTPMYYYQATARRVIPDLPGARVIFIARRPSERLKSLYDYARNNIGVLPRHVTFADFVMEMEKGEQSSQIGRYPMMYNGIEHCRYASYLRSWIQAMGRDRVRILVFEELVANPRAVLKVLADDLGIDAGFYDSYGFARQNESFMVSSQRLHRIVRQVKRRLPQALLKSMKPAYMTINTTAGKTTLLAPDRKAMARIDAMLSDCEAELAELLGRKTVWGGLPPVQEEPASV